jgi:hypothetical protein
MTQAGAACFERFDAFDALFHFQTHANTAA